ncbi:single stranded nucleic acid binding protein [Trichoglossum hirsutum]|uniref:Single stranded nucleic acid binding protein n=1 Tax=Trichoglossum hirsutum TaxID=265104 RepID=A0A9P8IBN4_9PEZI|nr:single stranded nucleic acid binding protein [Trichoglossum hirsutum]
MSEPRHETTSQPAPESTADEAVAAGASSEGQTTAPDIKKELKEQTGSEKVTDNIFAQASKATDNVFAQSSKPTENTDIYGMFGGGGKKKEAPAEEEENDRSGSSKAKAKEGEDEEHPEAHEPDVHYEPVIRLTEKVEVKTNEEQEEQTFKMRAKLFRFDRENREWKERGTGDVRLLKHKENGRTRLVMRRDKTLKVCANHYVVPDMKLSPNVGSDRSWVWNATADVSEGEPEAQTLAIRFANSDSKFFKPSLRLASYKVVNYSHIDANLFKEAFLKAQQENEAILKS